MNHISIDHHVYTRRPLDSHGRLPKEMRTYDVLDSLGIPYSRLDHDAAETIEACSDVDHLLGIHICKNLFLCNTQKSSFYLLAMPGQKRFKTSIFSKEMGCSRLSFAPAEYMEKYLDITPGSVSILGLIHDVDRQVKLVFDEDILKEEYFGCHPCVNTSSLKLKMSDILNKFLPYTGHSYTVVRLPE